MRDAARTASVRADLYASLADLLSFPTDAVFASLRSGETAGRLQALVDALPFRLEADPGLVVTGDAGRDAIEGEYIRVFDLPGAGGCPLYLGAYGDNRLLAMEDLARLYRHFGLRVSEGERQPPDHVPAVLEFMQFLCLRQAAAGADRAAEEAAGGAQRDLLGRYVAPAAGAMRSRLAASDALPVYVHVVRLLHAFAVGDLGYLGGMVGEASGLRLPVRVAAGAAGPGNRVFAGGPAARSPDPARHPEVSSR
jgi:DMSO reductase family type II enzyme chaperone